LTIESLSVNFLGLRSLKLLRIQLAEPNLKSDRGKLASKGLRRWKITERAGKGYVKESLTRFNVHDCIFSAIALPE